MESGGIYRSPQEQKRLEEADEDKYGLTLEEKYQSAQDYSLHKTEHMYKDALTGLRNRAALDDILDRGLKSLQRELRDGKKVEPMALVMIDIDYFKSVNDAHGHPGGDEVLRVLSALLQDSIRSTDELFRYGGEELGLVLYGDDEEAATAVADKLRLKIAEHTFSYDGKTIPVTASFGVAVARATDDATPSQLLKRADDALYTAKHSGRNMVVTDPGI